MGQVFDGFDRTTHRTDVGQLSDENEIEFFGLIKKSIAISIVRGAAPAQSLGEAVTDHPHPTKKGVEVVSDRN